MRGYLRADGRKGIRNTVVVAYLVECAHHVAREIAIPFREHDVHVIGFPGCFPNSYAEQMMAAALHPPECRGGAAGLARLRELQQIRARPCRARRAAGRSRPSSSRPPAAPGSSIAEGRAFVAEQRAALDATETVPMAVDELIVGTVCGGSDGTSGITGNPAAGRAFDMLVADGAACIFEETGELIGCEHIMASRAITPELGRELEASVAKAARYYATLGYGSFAAGNAEGGLTTIEEKSMGAYAKSGASPISGLIKPGDIPPRGGLYLLDVVPDGEVRFGLPQHQRQRRDRRADRLRQPRRALRHRARLGRRLGDLAGHQDLRQSRDLPADGRRHGCRRRPHPRRRRRRSTRSAARSATSCFASATARAPNPRSSATRNSS